MKLHQNYLFSFDFRENLKEIDLNPVIILENDAIAVDNVFIFKLRSFFYKKIKY